MIYLAGLWGEESREKETDVVLGGGRRRRSGGGGHGWKRLGDVEGRGQTVRSVGPAEEVFDYAD